MDRRPTAPTTKNLLIILLIPNGSTGDNQLRQLSRKVLHNVIGLRLEESSRAWTFNYRCARAPSGITTAASRIGLASPSRADDVATAQSVIRAQEQAFGRDDAAAAYSHAAPEIKQLFPQADIFLQMVQQAYQPVYRHKSFEFGEARAANGRIAQRVHIVDANGEARDAVHALEPQADGSLKITGCSLLKAGQAV